MSNIKLMASQEVTIRDVYDLINEFRDEIREDYVTKVEFNPVRAIAYGFVALLMTTVLGAIIAQVVRAVQ